MALALDPHARRRLAVGLATAQIGKIWMVNNKIRGIETLAPALLSRPQGYEGKRTAGDGISRALYLGGLTKVLCHVVLKTYRPRNSMNLWACKL